MRKILKNLFLIVAIVSLFSSCAKETTPTTTNPTPCYYVQWTGIGNCNNTGFPISNTSCCPTGSPFSYMGGLCYTTCEAANQATNGATVYRYNDGNLGGGGAGYNCISGNCTAVSSNAQYSTLSACQSACSNGGGNCPAMDSYVGIVSATFNNMCGNTNDLKIIFKNNSSQRLAIHIAIKKINGTWDCGIATTLSGNTDSYYACQSTGDYQIRAYLYTDWVGGCNFPNCP